MGNGLLIYMMAIKGCKTKECVNRAISIGKQHTDCPTDILLDTGLLFCSGKQKHL